MDNSTERQIVLRERVQTFFALESHYFRLKRILNKIVSTETRVANEGDLMYFFLNRYKAGTVMRSSGTDRLFVVKEEYKSALANYRKRYFDFSSRTGMGDLRWEGSTNPAILVREYALPLPKIVAFMWLLQSDLDYIFLENFDEIFTEFTIFINSTKQRYLTNHRQRVSSVYNQ